MAFVAGPLDPALVAVAESKHRAGQPLTAEEDLVLFERQHLNFRVFENAHYQFKKGLLEPEVWERHLRIIGARIGARAYAASMWEAYSWSFAASFQMVVDSIAATLELNGA